MWSLIPLGAVLFILGQMGAQTGLTVLPFDQHHIIAQIAGALLVLFGLTRWR